MNKGFYDVVLGKDAAKDETEFKEKYKEKLKELYHNVSNDVLYFDVINKLISESKISLPDDFLKKWLSRSAKEQMAAEQSNGYYDNYSKSLKQRLVVDKLMKDHNIKVERQEIDKYADDYIKKQFFMSPESQETNKKLFEEYKQHFLKEQKFVDEAFESIIRKKLLSFFEQEFVLKEKEISFDKFNEEVKKRREKKIY